MINYRFGTCIFKERRGYLCKTYFISMQCMLIKYVLLPGPYAGGGSLGANEPLFEKSPSK